MTVRKFIRKLLRLKDLSVSSFEFRFRDKELLLWVVQRAKVCDSFVEYWTFGRLDDRWKLKEVLPPGRGKKMVAEENVDEESSAGQIEWYYRQSRAT